MGGKAFGHCLPGDVFPRMSPAVYQRLKTRLTAHLERLYHTVQTPHEWPKKLDHGDLDFLVLGPKGTVNPQLVQAAIGAAFSVPLDGCRTSNYAIPSETLPAQYHQVDIHVCNDEGEFERIMFFNSYGGLGMVLGLLVKSYGLSLGTKGLKICRKPPDDTHPHSFQLSSSTERIMEFYGLSPAVYARGFTEHVAAFNWVATSRFFDPRRLPAPSRGDIDRKTPPAGKKFLEYAQALLDGCIFDTSAPTLTPEAVIEEAKAFFGLKADYDAIVRATAVRQALKGKLNGTKIMEWTGLQGGAIRSIINGMKARLSDDDIIDIEGDTLREIAIKVQLELGLVLNA